jgi:hypothetical protein
MEVSSSTLESELLFLTEENESPSPQPQPDLLLDLSSSSSTPNVGLDLRPPHHPSFELGVDPDASMRSLGLEAEDYSLISNFRMEEEEEEDEREPPAAGPEIPRSENVLPVPILPPEMNPDPNTHTPADFSPNTNKAKCDVEESDEHVIVSLINKTYRMLCYFYVFLNSVVFVVSYVIYIELFQPFPT